MGAAEGQQVAVVQPPRVFVQPCAIDEGAVGAAQVFHDDRGRRVIEDGMAFRHISRGDLQFAARIAADVKREQPKRSPRERRLTRQAAFQHPAGGGEFAALRDSGILVTGATVHLKPRRVRRFADTVS